MCLYNGNYNYHSTLQRIVNVVVLIDKYYYSKCGCTYGEELLWYVWLFIQTSTIMVCVAVHIDKYYYGMCGCTYRQVLLWYVWLYLQTSTIMVIVAVLIDKYYYSKCGCVIKNSKSSSPSMCLYAQ